jgi:hypothetical protein
MTDYCRLYSIKKIKNLDVERRGYRQPSTIRDSVKIETVAIAPKPLEYSECALTLELDFDVLMELIAKAGPFVQEQMKMRLDTITAERESYKQECGKLREQINRANKELS